MNIQRSVVAVSVLAAGGFLTAVSLRGDGPDVADKRPDGRGNVVRGRSRKHDASKGTAGSNGITYHGGPIMHTANLYYILYGNWPSGTPAILEHWGQVIAPSNYFNINTTYTDGSGAVPNAVTYRGAYIAPYAMGNSLSDSQIAQLASEAINAGFPGSPNTPGVVDPNGLYMVLTAPGVGESSGFLTQYCGWHWSGSFVSGSIDAGTIVPGFPVALFAFIGDAAGPSFGACAVQSNSPNNDAGADAMISVMAHELSEAVSDPQGNAWYDASGEENGDKCAWNFGSTYAAPNGSAANVNLSGTNYLMQQIWLNALGGECALSYASSPDFSVTVSGSQTVTPGGTSGNYTLTATPINGFNGAITWQVSPPAGITASTPSGSGDTATFTLTATSAGAGTYSIPITATSGSTQHSTTATLVVSSPTYSLTVTPSSQSVTRPSSGTTTVTFSVKVNPAAGFNEGVTLSVSGGRTGVTPSFPAGTNPVAANGTATLDVAVTNSARRNSTVTLTVTGTAAGQSNKTATARLTIH